MKILLVEDEAGVVSFINKGLTEEGYEVTIAMDGITGRDLFMDHEFDLVILDILLPGINGLELCKEIRKVNNLVPIIFLTALGTSENIVLGLNRGADDYLVKPFKFIELTARIRSLLRRSNGPHADINSSDEIYRIDDLEVNETSKTVVRNGTLISLTHTEYRLLLYFIKNQNKVLSRSTILENVWDLNFNLGTNVVDVYVNYLRNKIEKKADKLIHTVVGMGYIMKEEN